MRHIQSDLLDEARLPANLTIQNIFDEYTKGSVGGATGEQYTTLMTDMRALHFVEDETLREKSLVGFWCALPKRAIGLMVPTHFLGVCTASVKIKDTTLPSREGAYVSRHRHFGGRAVGWSGIVVVAHREGCGAGGGSAQMHRCGGDSTRDST